MSPYRSPEVALVVLLALGFAALLVAVPRSLPETSRWGLLDLRDWTMDANPPPADDAFFADLQTGPAARRPFDLALELTRPPVRGDSVTARRSVPVSGAGPFCFRVYLFNPYVGEGATARDVFEARVRAGDVESPPIQPAAHEDPVEVMLRGIEPRDGRVDLEVEITTTRDRRRESWRRASATRLQFADLWPCEAESR